MKYDLYVIVIQRSLLEIMMSLPIEIRVCKTGVFRLNARITAVWGLGNTTVHITTSWKDFLMKKGWDKIPRVWDQA